MTPSRIDPTPSVWDEEPVSELEMADAIRLMHDFLIQRFPSQDLNCLSPVTLGRHLMAACWHRDNIKVPPAPAEIRDLLKSTSPQGRHEILTLPHLVTIPALYEYDMRLAYLWCCKGLPYGAVMRRCCSEVSPGHKERCWWSAPQDWSHIGLIPSRGMGWIYPVQGEGWLDCRERSLADRLGWKIRQRECLYWESEGALDRWSDGMQWALRQVQEGGLVYRMLRRVALHTIGSLHRTEAEVIEMSPHPPPVNASTRFDQVSGLYVWRDKKPIRGRGQIYMHPEWTTTIWARCRVRITQAALQVPRAELVAIRQDALYTTTPQTQWESDKLARVGDIRRKWHRKGPFLAPRTIEDLDALRRGEG